jgi:hypothetical protein
MPMSTLYWNGPVRAGLLLLAISSRVGLPTFESSFNGAIGIRFINSFLPRAQLQHPALCASVMCPDRSARRSGCFAPTPSITECDKVRHGISRFESLAACQIKLRNAIYPSSDQWRLVRRSDVLLQHPSVLWPVYAKLGPCPR